MRAELKQIGALADEYATRIIADEAHEHVVYPPHEHTYIATLPGMAARTLSTSLLSKTYSIGTLSRMA